MENEEGSWRCFAGLVTGLDKAMGAREQGTGRMKVVGSLGGKDDTGALTWWYPYTVLCGFQG